MNILKRCIVEMDHSFRVVKCFDLYPDDPYPDQLSIFPHCRIQETPTGRLFYKEMYLKGLFTLDRLGWGPDHSGIQTVPDLSGIGEAEALELVQRLRHRYFRNGDSKVRQPAGAMIPESIKPYWLVPLQQEKDQVIKFHSPSTVVAFIHVISDWAEKKQRNIVFKVHPADPTMEVAEAVDTRIAGSPFLHLKAGNIHTLIKKSLGVAVINSGTGFESLIHGKPVAVFGDCDYKWASFPMTSDNLDDADDYFSSFSREQEMSTYCFLYHYLQRYAFETRGKVSNQLKDRVKVILQQTIDSYLSERDKPDPMNQGTSLNLTRRETNHPANNPTQVR
ncbi:MAG: hypothetical protein O7C75_07500 [Verrucomicrobia bacterium]|nr:hypothetical protein [Verrucomicrobiota bacterium]